MDKLNSKFMPEFVKNIRYFFTTKIYTLDRLLRIMFCFEAKIIETKINGKYLRFGLEFQTKMQYGACSLREFQSSREKERDKAKMRWKVKEDCFREMGHCLEFYTIFACKPCRIHHQRWWDAQHFDTTFQFASICIRHVHNPSQCLNSIFGESFMHGAKFEFKYYRYPSADIPHRFIYISFWMLALEVFHEKKKERICTREKLTKAMTLQYRMRSLNDFPFLCYFQCFHGTSTQ